MRRDDTANGRDPLILDVLFGRRQQSRAKNLGIVRRLRVFAWSRLRPRESHDEAVAADIGPQRDKREFGLKRLPHGSICLLEVVPFVHAFPCFYLFHRRPVFDSERGPRCDRPSQRLSQTSRTEVRL